MAPGRSLWPTKLWPAPSLYFAEETRAGSHIRADLKGPVFQTWSPREVRSSWEKDIHFCNKVGVSAQDLM